MRRRQSSRTHVQFPPLTTLRQFPWLSSVSAWHWQWLERFIISNYSFHRWACLSLQFLYTYASSVFYLFSFLESWITSQHCQFPFVLLYIILLLFETFLLLVAQNILYWGNKSASNNVTLSLVFQLSNSFPKSLHLFPLLFFL